MCSRCRKYELYSDDTEIKQILDFDIHIFFKRITLVIHRLYNEWVLEVAY